MTIFFFLVWDDNDCVFVCDVGWVYANVGWQVVIFVLWVDRKGFTIDVKWKR